MTDFSDFQPIFVRTEDDIRTDFDIRVNAGLTTQDPDWIDTRQGSWYFISTQPMVIEFAAAYDRMNEAIAAGILATSWGDKLDLHGESYGVERIPANRATGVVTFSGVEGTLVGTGARVSPVQTDPDVEPPFFQTTESGAIDVSGEIDLAVEAIEAGANGNIAAGEIELLQSGITGITAVDNAAEFGGGADIETDEDFKARLRLIFLGKGSGTVADYTREALRWPGVGRVTIIPHADGPGTVSVIVLDDNGDPVGGSVVDDLQDHMDPEPALGKGWAPINHIVTVSTPTATGIYVTADIVFEAGFSLDGEGGTVAMRESLTEAATEYLDQLEAGEDVIYNHVMAQFFEEEGVTDVTNLKIGTSPSPSGTANITVNNDHVAQAATVTLDS